MGFVRIRKISQSKSTVLFVSSASETDSLSKHSQNHSNLVTVADNSDINESEENDMNNNNNNNHDNEDRKSRLSSMHRSRVTSHSQTTSMGFSVTFTNQTSSDED